MPRTPTAESWGHSTVRTACPLDCPDSCTLDVTVEKGRVVKIDGGDANPVTRGYICAQGAPLRRAASTARIACSTRRSARAPKGQGTFTRVTWDEALDQIAQRMDAIRDSAGAEAILPFCYGGSNGLLTQDTNDAQLFRGFGTSRLARTVCAAPTGAANQALYGKMPGVTYDDYVHARLIVLWGVNPSASGIHLVPFIKEARKPRRAARRHRSARDVAGAAGRSAPRAAAGHRPAARARAAPLPVRARASPTTAFLAEHARGADGLRARAERVDDRARGARLRASTPATSSASPSSTRRRRRR